MKQTIRILSVLALVLVLASCRTTVPGPAYVIRIASQGTPPVQTASIGSLQVEWAPDSRRTDVHFDAIPDTTLDGGVMLTTTATGHIVVTYPGDYVRANALALATGFELRLSFYSLNTMLSQHGYAPLVTVHVLDRSGVEFANGAGFAPWPLDAFIDGGSPQLIAVSCKMDAMSQMLCAGM